MTAKITETMRQEIYQEIDRTYPARKAVRRTGPASRRESAEVTRDLAVRRRHLFMDLKERLISEVLFHLHTLFSFSADDTTVAKAVREAIEHLYATEDSCRRNGPFDAHAYGRTLFRTLWHGVPKVNGSASMVSGISHLEQANFFSKTPQEIGHWAKRFLMIERYYRLDAVESENRLDRYRSLRSLATQSSLPVIHHLEDLLIWLEFRQLEETHLKEYDIGLLSRKLSKELERILATDTIEGDPLQPTIYALLACHQYCQSETLDPGEEKRLEQLFATRQLNSLLDLMRVVLHKTTRDHRLPEARVILDQLQRDKFNISHQGFRDPYEADLVPIEDTERVETARLPLFIPLGMLSGEYGQDLAMSRQMLMEWHDRIINHIVEDCEAFVSATVEPLPRAGLFYKVIRFAVSWTLAKCSWPIQEPRETLEESVKSLLPENAVRNLVRPRKGYEIKSRQELNQRVVNEIQRRREALDRVAMSRNIQGYYDYAQFTRYVTFHALREIYGDTPGIELDNVAPLIREKVRTEWVREMGKKWSIKAHLVHPHSLEPLQQYLREIAPPEMIIPHMEKNFATSTTELQDIYQEVLDESTPLFFQLLVAHGRNRAHSSRLAASTGSIPGMLTLLAPPLDELNRISSQDLRKDFMSAGAALYRAQLRPYLIDASEWTAYLAWQTKTYLESQGPDGGPNAARFLEGGDMDGLLAHLERTAGEADHPPNALFGETPLSTLLKIIRSQDEGESVPEARIQEVAALLPMLDCAACGQPACRDFARSLLAGRSDPRHCLQLPPERVPPLIQKVETLKKAVGVRSESILDLLRHRHLWRGSPERIPFQKVLSAHIQKTRHLFVERVKGAWSNLSQKPGIFKCPELEAFYGDLHRYMGHEAAERLREEERQFLTTHGELRQAAEWRLIKARQDWLTLANRNRQSRPLLQARDAAWIALEAYDNVFFLHQLGEKDRQLVLRYRLEAHQDGFSHWWNEDLLSMNHPDFTIRDWEDFSKIIKNAYWHQESSPAVEDTLSMLEGEVLSEKDTGLILDRLLHYEIDREQRGLTSRNGGHPSLRGEDRGEEVANLSQLRDVIGRLIDEASFPERGSSAGSELTLSLQVPAADQLAVKVQEAWERFQEAGLVFSAQFACLWDELLPGEKEALTEQRPFQGWSAPIGGAVSAPSSNGGWVLANWSEPMEKRVAFIRALISHALRTRHREAAECEYLKKAKDKSKLPLGSFRVLIRSFLRRGTSREEIARELGEMLSSNRGLRHRLFREMLGGVIHGLQYERLCRFNNSFLPASRVLDLQTSFWEAFPELKKTLEAFLDKHNTLDRERLFHYLFLFAKMEGNLDTLTALLREIRETSDIIEAAWLRFTEERLVEGPGPKSAPGVPLGIPLLTSRLKEKEPVNVGLRQGVSRREKKNVASAINEIVTIIQYHVLLSMERHSSQGGTPSILEDIKDVGYDLSGIDEEALERAVEREWDRREQLKSQKIWIYATVTARRLAAQHPELLEAGREFYKVRLDLLKEDGGGKGHYEDVAGRRGVALGQIKEEMYRQLSDLLEPERIATFQNRIRQIVAQLDQRREEISKGWLDGEINSRTVFHVLRQYQKSGQEPSWSDFERFLRDHWFLPLDELRGSNRPDREERIRHLDDRFKAILGVSLLEIESEAAAEADRNIEGWMERQLEGLEECG